MSNARPWKAPLLPPPAGVILLYAADGLSAWKNCLSEGRRPRTPNRSLWVPMFRQLVDSHEGLRTLQSLAEAGMRAWRCPTGALDCLKAAFRDLTLRPLMISALENFAATAREKVTLPEAARPYPPAPAPPPPRPEKTSSLPASPRRPRPAKSGPKLGLG